LALDNDSIKHTGESGSVVIEVINNNKTVKILLQNMLNLLKELENSYPNNIQVK